MRAFKRLLGLAALLPAARLAAGLVFDALGANPIEVVTRSTGTWALVGLLCALAVSPLRRISGWHDLIDVRRMLGLFAFFYALLHLLTYVWLDQFFDWGAMIRDVVKRPFITIGLAAFLSMVPLAVTSTDGMVRRLGARRWIALHRLVYLAAVCGVLHYWWLVKRDITQPALYAALLVLLLALRLAYRRGRRRRPAAGAQASRRSPR
jgi:sulfoxide reductase heme-binding subunit YedZ